MVNGRTEPAPEGVVLVRDDRSREQLIEEAQAAADAETLRHFAERESEAVRLAVLAEREACAALAESMAGDMAAEVPVEGGAALAWFAAKIRARGEK
jgi:hypothetical protein